MERGGGGGINNYGSYMQSLLLNNSGLEDVTFSVGKLFQSLMVLG